MVGITKKGADYFRPLLGKRDASDIKNYPVFTKGKLKLVSKNCHPGTIEFSFWIMSVSSVIKESFSSLFKKSPIFIFFPFDTK